MQLHLDHAFGAWLEADLVVCSVAVVCWSLGSSLGPYCGP